MSYLGGSAAGALGALLGNRGFGQWSGTSSVSDYERQYMRMLAAAESIEKPKEKYQFRGEFAWLRNRVDEVCWKPTA